MERNLISSVRSVILNIAVWNALRFIRNKKRIHVFVKIYKNISKYKKKKKIKRIR